ncbi:MAG TPA: SRPBCC family protein [Bacteroidia bacterium]|jgi:effector-binding domain-containing protein|nr:SRPBCC family protein [Bacteroidia bacterium]
MKKVLYVILALACIYLVLCVMGPSVIKVERSATMNASADAVKSQIVDYSVFKNWSPWADKDTAMKITIEGEAGKVGHKYSWEGNKNVGKGTMELTTVATDTIIEKLVFDGRGASDVIFVFKPEGAGTNVTWIMNMNIGFFGRGMMMFMKGKMDGMLGGDFEKGLAKLKAVAETVPPATGVANYEVKESEWPERTFIGTKSTNLTMETMPAFFGENFHKIGAELGKNKIKPESAPSCLVFKWDDASKSGDMAAVMGVTKGTKAAGWETYTTPAGKVLQVEYFGDYNKIGDAHMAIGKYLKEKNLTQGLVLEEYITDPMAEKDTAKWQTNIYYMVK